MMVEMVDMLINYSTDPERIVFSPMGYHKFSKECGGLTEYRELPIDVVQQDQMATVEERGDGLEEIDEDHFVVSVENNMLIVSGKSQGDWTTFGIPAEVVYSAFVELLRQTKGDDDGEAEEVE